MENLLLVADDIDDLFHAAMHTFPRIAGFFSATTLFIATVAAFVLNPHVALGALGVFFSVSLLERVRRRRLQAE
jgi:hypothetical protein